MTKPKTPKDSPLNRKNSRLNLVPTPELIELIERKWPVRITRHALCRAALKRGLEQLATLPPAECRAALIDQVMPLES